MQPLYNMLGEYPVLIIITAYLVAASAAIAVASAFVVNGLLLVLPAKGIDAGLGYVVKAIDFKSEWFGRVTAWFALGTVLTCFTQVFMRYALSSGRVWIQDFYVWQHAIVFMAGAGFTWLHNGHVRVDLFYTNWSSRRKAWADIFGTFVFAFPFIGATFISSIEYVSNSWGVFEGSGQGYGLQAVYLLKSVIWLFCAVVFLQGISFVAKRVLFLRGDKSFSPDTGRH